MNGFVRGTLVCLSLCLCGWSCGKSAGDFAEAHTYNLYFLGGQSNMEGFGYNSDLPEQLHSPQPEVLIFHGNDSPDDRPVDGRGIWASLRPGHGTGFSSNGRSNDYSDRFGPELTFGSRIAELEKDSRVAIIKYARGGSSLASGASPYGTWDPDYDGGNGINQYDHFLAAVRNALEASDVDGDGTPDSLIPAGIIWMQGEGDALHSAESARQYGENLARLMALMRGTFHTPDLPVVIGRISDSGRDTDGMMMDYGAIVRRAQADFVAADSNAALVTSTDGYDFLGDGWHYTGDGVIDLGREFAEAVHALHLRTHRHIE